MKEFILRTQMQVPISVRDAFAVFEDPRNLATITPPWLNFRILNPEESMRKGARFRYVFRWQNLRMLWRTIISEYEAPFFFVDEMEKGPYVYWKHSHTFHPTVEGVLVTDQVEYALPLGWLGAMVHKFWVAPQLKEIFRYRQMALNEMWCGGKAHWTEPVIIEKQDQNPRAGTANRETHTHAIL